MKKGKFGGGGGWGGGGVGSRKETYWETESRVALGLTV